MKHSTRQKIFWALSILVVLSMILSTILVVFSGPQPPQPTPSGFISHEAGPLLASLASPLL